MLRRPGPTKGCRAYDDYDYDYDEDDDNFLVRFSKNTRMSNFVKIRPVGAELFHAGGQTDRHT